MFFLSVEIGSEPRRIWSCLANMLLSSLPLRSSTSLFDLIGLSASLFSFARNSFAGLNGLSSASSSIVSAVPSSRVVADCAWDDWDEDAALPIRVVGA